MHRSGDQEAESRRVQIEQRAESRDVESRDWRAASGARREYDRERRADK
jgi:hypothetical protein